MIRDIFSLPLIYKSLGEKDLFFDEDFGESPFPRLYAKYLKVSAEPHFHKKRQTEEIDATLKNELPQGQLFTISSKLFNIEKHAEEIFSTYNC